MNSLTAKLSNSPVAARVAPFAIFLTLTFCQGSFGEAGRYWIYLVKSVVGAWMLWVIWPVVKEMRWRMSWQAVVVGIAIFALWVGLDSIVPNQQEIWIKLGLSKAPETAAPAWNPFLQFGAGSALGWFFVVVRIAGSSIVVPPLEEMFYRSFLYRWIAKPDFTTLRVGDFLPKSFLLTAVVFGLAHNEWLAGIFCALAYQGLVCWKQRLGDAMTAHAITNFLLGVWVVGRGAWNFW